MSEKDKGEASDPMESVPLNPPTRQQALARPCTKVLSPSAPPPAECWGARHTLVGMGCLLSVLLNTMRANLYITIVAMVSQKDTSSNTDILNGTSITGSNYSSACPVPLDDHLNGNETSKVTGDFDWDERTQGLLLGAYFYGNVATNILGGRVAEHLGGRLVVGVGVAMSALMTLLSPLTASLSTNLFVAVRIVIGMAQGITMPAITRCLVSWVPPQERSKSNTIVFSGTELGTIICLATGGWLCEQLEFGGWRLVYYIFGGLGLVWCLAWFLLITERPEDHPRISDQEKAFLMSQCQVKRGKAMKMPWGKVLRNPAVWAVIVMHVGHNWGFYTLASLIPSYLTNIQHYDIKTNGLVSALPYLSKYVLAQVFSQAMTKAAVTGKLSVLAVRRFSMMFGSYLPAIALIVLCLVGCNRTAAVAVLCIAVGVSGSSFCGVLCSHQDLTPNLAGTLYGFTNTIANITGFLAPSVAGLITQNNQTLEAWNTIFLISAGTYVCSCTFYVVFISAQVQAFDDPQGRSKDANRTHKGSV